VAVAHCTRPDCLVANVGIGLVFWGTAEPAFLVGNDAFAGLTEQEQQREAMRFVFHHWGFSPWAVYAIVGLGLAYFGFRRGMPMTIRSLFHPLLGDRIHGPIGHAIDILAVVATIFGIATSLGLGAQQVAAGMGRVFDIDVTGSGGLVMIIAVITAFATISVVMGLDKGIKRLSQINIVAATVVGRLVVLLLGPTLLLVTAFVDNTGYYIQNIVQTLAFTGSYEAEAAGLVEGWTVFYWAWWISWSPFVGMFIARVSRGRTIREFVLGVLVAPTMVSFAWFTIFGNSTLQPPGGCCRHRRGRRGRRHVRPAGQLWSGRWTDDSPVPAGHLRRGRVLRDQFRLRIVRGRHADVGR
jgi:choline/glycine/proline betaine transport protein